MRRWIWKVSVILGVPIPKKFILKTARFPYDLNFQKVSFYSRKCKKVVLLSGRYFVSPDSHRCIIIVQGYGRYWGEPEVGTYEIVKYLVEHGFHVLAMDLRAHGESGGRKISLGYYEVYDLLGARDFLVKEKKISLSKIGLVGFSYGAMVYVLAAGKNCFGAALLDSVTGNIFVFIERILKKLRLSCRLLKLIKCLSVFLFQIDVEGLDMEKAAKKISAPCFVIYGKEDKNSCAPSKELLFLKKSHPLDREWPTDASHSKSYTVYREEYLRKIVDFFNQAIEPTCQK